MAPTRAIKKQISVLYLPVERIFCLRMKKREFLLFIISIFVGMQLTKSVMYTYVYNKCWTVASVAEHLVSPKLPPQRFIEELEDFRFNPGPQKKLVLVGIMTHSKYFQTRDRAIQMTWLKSIPGDVIFFVGNSTDLAPAGMPVVRLNQAPDHVYPPRLKMFEMLEYMYKNLADKYEYFIRADDDVFIKGQELGSLLSSLDSREKIYMGHRGQGVPEEKGKLGMGKDYFFCIGGPGIILSHKALKMLGPHLDACTLHPVKPHDDTELGRCMEKYLNVQCKSNPKLTTLFYHNYRDAKGSFNHELGSKESYAFTLHPLKNSSSVFRLSIHFKQDEIKWLKEKADMLRNDLEMAKRSIIAKQLKHYSMPTLKFLHEIELLNQKPQWGTPLRFWYGANDDSANWEYIEKNSIYSKENMYGSAKQNLNVKKKNQILQTAARTLFNRYLEGTDDIKLKNILRAYRYMSPVQGVQHLLHVYLLQPKSKSSHYNATFITSQHLLPLMFTEEEDMFQEGFHIRSRHNNVNGSNELKQINLILPISKKVKEFARFTKTLEKIFKETLENLNVILVVYKDPNRSYLKNIDKMKRLESQYASMKLEVTFSSGKFSRAVALQHGVKNCRNDSLLLFLDVDMVITEAFLHRVRINTIYRQRVYFPVVFKGFNPETICYKPNCKKNPFLFDQNNGFWLFFGFGVVSIYKKDFLDVGGFDTKIITWGGEDVGFYERCLKSNLTVFRAPDLAAEHVYHQRQCLDNLDAKHYQMCIGSKNAAYGSLYSEAAAIYRFSEILN
ncbi:chondroitin sulfate synthase 1-like [Octopus sinensis]|uniref:Hexosyltransferase n=1 Tax=Octopus sinensis TaxID=2607531 RepID=A0A6P7TS08_9MOLL|nr:chondroitin sulfate synthase 1-like [Octopus sinensis]